MNITVAYMTVTAYTRSTLQLTSCYIAILIKSSIDCLILHVTKTFSNQYVLFYSHAFVCLVHSYVFILFIIMYLCIVLTYYTHVHTYLLFLLSVL